MTGLKRPAVLVAVMAFLALLFAVPASAQPYSCTPSLSLSTQTPQEGASLTVTGRDYAANTTVTLTLHSRTYNLGTVTTDANGGFSRSVTLPGGVLGNHSITGTGRASGCNGDAASASLTIGGAGDAGAGSGGSGSGGASGGLSNTGVAVFGLGALGLVLLLGGGAMLFAGRRRRVSV